MLNKLKDILAKSIRNKKLHVFGLFLLLSFLLLALSKLSKSYTETVSLSLEYQNIPENIAIELEGNETIDITLKTYGFNLLATFFSKKSTVINFENYAELEENAYVFISEQKKAGLDKELGSNFEIIDIKPDTLRVFFSELATRKVPIVLNSSVDYLSGYDSLKGLTIDPDSVNVIGSQKDVQDINEIQTKELKLKNIKDNISTSVDLIKPDRESLLKLSSHEVSVKAIVEKFTEGTLELPVEIINLPSKTQMNYFPKTIKISFEVGLEDYKLVKPSDFRIECDFQDIKNNQQSFFIARLKKTPDIVKRVKMKQNKIEYIITQ